MCIYIVLSNSLIYPRTKYQFTNLKMLDDFGLISLFTSHKCQRPTTNVNDTQLLGSKLLVFKMMGTTRASLSETGEVFKTTKRVDCWVMLSLPHDIPSYLVFPTANRLGFLLYSHGKGSKISSSCRQVVVMSTPQDMASTKSFSHKYICFTLDPRRHVGSLDLWHCFVGLISGLYILILTNCEGIGLELEGKQSISCLTATQSHCNLYEFFHIEPSL